VALTGGVGRRAATNSSPAAAPGLRDAAGRPRAPPPGGGPAGRGPSLRKLLWKRTLRQLSSLPLAIGELAVIAALSAVGTIIEQNKPLEFYAQARRPAPQAPTWVRQAADELSLSGSWGRGHRSDSSRADGLRTGTSPRRRTRTMDDTQAVTEHGAWQRRAAPAAAAGARSTPALPTHFMSATT